MMLLYFLGYKILNEKNSIINEIQNVEISVSLYSVIRQMYTCRTVIITAITLWSICKYTFHTHNI